MKNNEQLRECINSGQVSAAQVVAHQEAGELPKPYWYANSTEDRELMWPDMYTADQMRAHATAAIVAERAEVARLREALEVMLKQFTKTPSSLRDSEARIMAHKALTAPGENHE